MALLHETGRITRQEAASMLPVRTLEVNGHELALDMCAAPGSKTTQLGERLHPHGVVVANEPVSGRLNMLVSNRSRLSLANVVVTQHDGRHFGRLPPPGFDLVLADVPCTGTATTRKNRDVWWDWTPKESRKMFKMQVDIAQRGAALLVPGGTLVYSTCSVDPVENEAVVAELLRRCPYLETVPVHLDGIVLHEGLTEWPLLDEQGGVVPEHEHEHLPFFSPSHRPPSQQPSRTDGSLNEEAVIADQLVHCRRLWHTDNDTGGFFVAHLRHRSDATPEGVARAYLSRRAARASEHWKPSYKQPPKPTANTVVKAEKELIEHVSSLYGMDLTPYSVWVRGKRLNLAPPMVATRLFDPDSPTNKGDLWPGGTFHPLRVVHAGLPAFTLKKASWRSRQESLYAFGEAFSENLLEIDAERFVRLLRGWAPLVPDFEEEIGSFELPKELFTSLSDALGSRNHFRMGWRKDHPHDRQKRTKHTPQKTRIAVERRGGVSHDTTSMGIARCVEPLANNRGSRPRHVGHSRRGDRFGNQHPRVGGNLPTTKRRPPFGQSKRGAGSVDMVVTQRRNRIALAR